MEFSFKYSEIFRYMDSEPMMMVMCTAFGVPLLMLLVCLPLYILKKLGLKEALNPYYSILFIPLSLSWLLGFIIMIILLMTEVSGTRMIIIWILMVVTYFFFAIFNRRPLNRWIDDMAKKNPNK